MRNPRMSTSRHISARRPHSIVERVDVTNAKAFVRPPPNCARHKHLSWLNWERASRSLSPYQAVRINSRGRDGRHQGSTAAGHHPPLDCRPLDKLVTRLNQRPSFGATSG
jgi:hypothetical protein